MSEIVITKDEAKSLAEHLEFYIIQEIRDCSDLDGIGYLINLVHVYEKCKGAEKSRERALEMTLTKPEMVDVPFDKGDKTKPKSP